MLKGFKLSIVVIIVLLAFSCINENKKSEALSINENHSINAENILGNPEYLAISYGGYRHKDRNIQPTIPELKEDIKILSAMGIKVLRTYNVHFEQAANLLKAITELKQEDSNFEMYVMLGIWIDCKNAFNSSNGAPDHNQESERNPVEVKTAVELATQYPEIVKILAVGNEAMVKWATSYYVEPWIILKWVNHLQDLKQRGDLPKDLWITSSDDYSSWGGGDAIYHTKDLEKLAHAVDYISMHTYAYHNSHYNPEFWKVPENEENLSDKEKIDAAMLRALEFAKTQYDSVVNYMKSIGVNKPIHIGETGWASISGGHYGKNGSRATDEYKQGLYYKHIRNWTNKNNISVFYFEAFDEQWKDAADELGSENHFGLINLKSEAKYPLWSLVDDDVFKGLTRDGKPITKTYNGNLDALMKDVLVPNTDYPRD
ncbi:glycosyl hydrolase family 17 protein [Winogradskyella endarachnes]|uniref:Endo-1,3-beta-glucanase btgC n=1 Tax=Winogradskyella endarachnes TaxID=2681965 RepID=A0A6L6U6C1_9FLAO|nr:glycosyl hydrolase family 17 protein [Winogradskyella endarachnes]MUU77783.1 glycosyl hydrolase family 17 [Winogradskyella endarachnes]